MIFLVFFFGAIIGSFLNVLILRLPKDKSINGRSHCPHCKHVLAPLDLVPIFSYLFLGGRCRYCRVPISSRYVFIEIISGLLLAFAYLKFLPVDLASTLEFVRAGFILFVLILVFAIDFEHFLILDKIVFPSALILLLLNFAVDISRGSTIQNSLTGNGLLAVAALLIFFGAIYYLSGGRWMGFGDVKLSLFLGLATPYPYIAVNVFMAFMIGAIVGIGLLLFGSKNLKTEIPFGTFLSASTFIVIFFGPQLLDFYLKIIGLWYLAKY